MKLREVSAQSEYNDVVITAMEASAPILRDLEFYTKDGSSDNVKEANEPDADNDAYFRDLNEEDDADPVSRNEIPVPKKIVSFVSKADRVLEARNQDIATELIQDLRVKSTEAGYAIQSAFFTGDSATNPKKFNGISRLVKPSRIITPDEDLVLSLGGDGAKLGQQKFMEGILNFFSSVPGGASHAYFPDPILNRMIVVAKNLGFYHGSLDALGDQIDMIGRTVVRSAGRNYAGTPYLDLTETIGGTSGYGSAFAVRHGEGINLSALTTVGVGAAYVGLTNNKFHTVTVDLDMALARQHPAAIVQLRRLKLG